MNRSQPLNVFKGPDAVARYFDPDLQPPTPVVEIPDRLNPFRADNVRIYAKMLTALPAQNVKALPALNMLRNDPTAANKSIVEASSGSTVISMSMIARVLWGNDDVCAFVTNKKHPDSLRLLRFFGLKISLYGGLAQQEPVDPRGIMCRLRRKAKKHKGIRYPGQYDNHANWQAHARWTGPQILRQLPEINVCCSTVGTGGCITGTGVHLKSHKPTVKVIGVCNVFGDPTPGPRHFPGFESSPFPWQETIDHFEEVASAESYRMSMRLSREGIVCGPSSGEALYGLLSYLEKERAAGRLSKLADPITGEVSCVFICCDLPYQYMDNYFSKLSTEEFPPILNEILLNCDQDRYDERWELLPEFATSLLSTCRANDLGLHADWFNVYGILCGVKSPSTDSMSSSSSRSEERTCCIATPQVDILDFRRADDFACSHVLGAHNMPLKSISSHDGDIFEDSLLLHNRWSELREAFEAPSTRSWLGDRKATKRQSTIHDGDSWRMREGLGSKPLIVLCYDGETARMATSMLRAQGHEAYSVQGGHVALVDTLGSRF